MANVQPAIGASAEATINAAAEEVRFRVALDEAGWTEWGGDVAFPFEAWMKTTAKMPFLHDTRHFQLDPPLKHFRPEVGLQPYQAYAAQVIEPLAVMWHQDTGAHGGAAAKQHSHACRNWWCQLLDEGHIFTPNYDNEAFLAVTGTRLSYKGRATKDPYYMRFSACIVNERKKNRR